MYLSAGFESVSHIQHGFAWSEAGFCRLLMGQSDAAGAVTSLYDDVPNRISAPNAVIMFADDASATIPAASQLEPAQVPTFPSPHTINQYHGNKWTDKSVPREKMER